MSRSNHPSAEASSCSPDVATPLSNGTSPPSVGGAPKRLLHHPEPRCRPLGAPPTNPRPVTVRCAASGHAAFNTTTVAAANVRLGHAEGSTTADHVKRPGRGLEAVAKRCA
jgi:hypothetical protein